MAAVPQQSSVPERLGRYEIVQRLSAGGMGEVFVGRMVGPGGFLKPVAIKRIHPHLASDTSFIDMLHDEARVASAVRHPNIVTTIDVGSEGNDHFVVLDYVSGDPLSRIVRDLKKRDETMPPWAVAWIGAQVAAALHAAHEAKSLSGEPLDIVHRDVSLGNIMLSDDGHPMLFDFGVAKAKQRLFHTTDKSLKGKLSYMAPELFRGKPVTRKVDIFALGVVLYEMITGIAPFARESDLDTITALTKGDVPPPSEARPGVDLRLDPLVMRAMSRDPSDRYENADELERALRTWARMRSLPHDAPSAAKWYASVFPERLKMRSELLARVADSSRLPAPPIDPLASSQSNAAIPIHPAPTLTSLLTPAAVGFPSARPGAMTSTELLIPTSSGSPRRRTFIAIGAVALGMLAVAAAFGASGSSAPTAPASTDAANASPISPPPSTGVDSNASATPSPPLSLNASPSATASSNASASASASATPSSNATAIAKADPATTATVHAQPKAPIAKAKEAPPPPPPPPTAPAKPNGPLIRVYQ